MIFLAKYTLKLVWVCKMGLFSLGPSPVHSPLHLLSLSCSCFLTSDWLLTSSLMLATSFLSPETHILSSSSSSPPPPPPAGRWTRNTSLLSSLTLPVPSSHALALHSFPCLPPERERWEGEEERGGQEGEGGIQKRRRGRRKKSENWGASRHYGFSLNAR